MRKFMLNQIVI